MVRRLFHVSKTSAAFLPIIGYRGEHSQRGRNREVRRIFDAEMHRCTGYELFIKSQSCSIWHQIVANSPSILDQVQTEDSIDSQRIRLMLDFIHHSYQQKITLSQLSHVCNISKSECGRCFQRMLNIPPFDYILHYRIEVAARLLRDSQTTISEISYGVGFSEISYFISSSNA